MLNLNACIHWMMDHPSLKDVQDWQTNQLNGIQIQIDGLTQTIQELTAQYAQYQPDDQIEPMDAQLNRLEADYQEAKNGSRWKYPSVTKRLNELSAEIEETKARLEMARGRQDENRRMADSIQSTIEMTKTVREAYQKNLKQSEEAWDEFKSQTRLFTAIPFCAVDLPQLLSQMDEESRQTGKTQQVEIQLNKNYLQLSVLQGKLKAAFNEDLILEGGLEEEQCAQWVSGLYAVFPQQLCKLYEMDEKKTQAMAGQYFDASDMDSVFLSVKQIDLQMDQMKAAMKAFVETFHLPEDNPIETGKDLKDRMIRLENEKNQLKHPNASSVMPDDEAKPALLPQIPKEIVAPKEKPAAKPKAKSKPAGKPQTKIPPAKPESADEPAQDSPMTADTKMSFEEFNDTYRKDRTEELNLSRQSIQQLNQARTETVVPNTETPAANYSQNNH